MRDYTVGDTFDVKFTTRRFSSGAPYALASGVISAYPDNSTTQLTAGITLTADFDSVTGLNNVRVVASGANGYAAGSTYHLVITTGTVDSVSVVGEVVGEFTLGRTAAFARLGAPAGASVSADVAAMKVDTAAILVDTGTTLDGRIPAALVSGRIDASVGAMAANVMTAASTAADFLAEVNAEVVDALATDTYAEPGQGTPAATATLAAKMNYLYKAWRNRHTQTATEYAVYADDATTKDHEAIVSDDGVTFDRGEVSTGA
jgi:hypothetical protein